MNALKNITPLGWVGIIILFNSTLIGGSSQLGDLALSPGAVKAILAVATLGNGFLGGLVTMLSTQGSVVRQVAAMPGIDSIRVNADANQTLAQIAVSGSLEAAKVEAIPSAAGKVAAIAKAAATVLLIAFAVSFLLPSGEAMAQVKLGPVGQKIANDLSGKPTVGLTGAPVTDLQNFFNAQLLPDLQYAKKLADASKNTITADCYGAWIDIINTQQTAVKNADGTDIAMPTPHLITEFEKLVELRNALQPESVFMVKCSPVASMVKKDIAGFIGIVISGGAGLATLVPGL